VQGEIDKSTIRVGDFNTCLQKWANPAGRKSVGIELNSTMPSISWI